MEGVEQIILPNEKLHPDLLSSIVKVKGKCYVKNTLCDIPIEVLPEGECSNNTFLNRSYLYKKTEYDKCIKEENYKDIFILLDKQYHMSFFLKWYKEIYNTYGDKKYYELLGQTLTYVDHHHPYKHHYHKLLYTGSNPLLMMNSKERVKYNKLPSFINIFRGVSSDIRLTKNNFQSFVGNSWTLDKEKSIWFSTNYIHSVDKPNHYIFSYMIPKSEVLSYFTDRKEDEIFVDYNRLNFDNIVMYTVKTKTSPFQKNE